MEIIKHNLQYSEFQLQNKKNPALEVPEIVFSESFILQGLAH